MKVLAGAAPANPARPSTMLLHDEANGRAVAFHLLPGQSVPAHNSDSTVFVFVTAGTGRFHGDAGSELLSAGQSAVFAPGEQHAIDALDEPLHFIALIAPRPGG